MPRSIKDALSRLRRRRPQPQPQPQPQPVPVKRESPFLSLPIDIHDRIADFLSPLSQACMALACKHLRGIHGRALCSLDLRFPEAFHPSAGIKERSDYFVSERWKFLKYLEDDRWQCCSRCLKLHRVSEFPKGSLLTDPEERYCNLGQNSGIVDLCPCIKLTYHDKLRLVQQLRLDPKRPRTLSEVDLSAESPHIWHQCEIPGNCTFVTKLYAVLEEEHLRIVTRYHIYYPRDEADNWDMAPVRLCCPHLAALTYAAQVQQAEHHPNSRCIVPYEISSARICCRWCKTRTDQYVMTALENGERYKLSFRTTRNLGLSTPFPDENWFWQTVYSQDPSQDAKGFDSCPYYGLARFRPDLFPNLQLSDLIY